MTGRPPWEGADALGPWAAEEGGQPERRQAGTGRSNGVDVETSLTWFRVIGAEGNGDLGRVLGKRLRRTGLTLIF